MPTGPNEAKTEVVERVWELDKSLLMIYEGES